MEVERALGTLDATHKVPRNPGLPSFASWHDVNICRETTGRTQHGKKPFLLGSGVLPGWLLQQRQLMQGHELALAA